MRKNLLIYPNPYAAVDHEGLPSGVVGGCPKHGNGGLVYPGASIDTEKTLLTEHEDIEANPMYAGDESRSKPQRTRWTFSKKPVELPSTEHYRYCLRAGDLIPADEDTSQAVQLVPHVEPLLRLAQARLKAIEDWVAHHGEEPAFAKDDELDVWPELAPLCEKIKEERDAKKNALRVKAEAEEKAHAEKHAAEEKSHDEKMKQTIASLLGGK